MGTILRGTYTPPNTGAQGPKDYNYIGQSTLGVTVAQTASFLLLRLPTPNLPQQDQFRPVDAPEPDTPEGVSPLGTPIYGKIVLGNESGENNYTDALGNRGSYPTVELDCALVTADYNNRVIVTGVQGLPNSVKEFISTGDLDITITGRFDNTIGVAPVEFISALNKIFRAPVPIPVFNYFLNTIDVHHIVIMPGSSVEQLEAGYSTQVFTIRAISDIPMDEILP